MRDHSDWLVQMLGHTALIEGVGIEATGSVESVDGPTAVVICDEEVPATGDPLDVTISVFAPDALYRVQGPAVAAEKGLICGGEMAVERIQRRRWPRRRVDLPVTLCPVDGATRLEGVPGRTVDLSVGGACVETLRRVEGEGDPMVILRLPDGATVVTNSSTVSVEELPDVWRYRVAFRDLDDRDAARLEKLTAIQG